MYSENRRNAAVRRSNDEFLRRLIGGELQAEPAPAKCRAQSGPREQLSCSLRERPMQDRHPRADSSGVVCNDNDLHDPCGDCPTVLNAPALAMVYSPRQCWRGVLNPHDALFAGSLFTELVLPLEQDRNLNGKEDCGRKYAP